MCQGPQSSSMGVEEVVTLWVKIISVEICKNTLNNRK